MNSTRWPPIARPRVSPSCRSLPACIPTCPPSTARCTTKRASPGKRLRPHQPRLLRRRRQAHPISRRPRHLPCIVGAWGYHLPWLGQEKCNSTSVTSTPAGARAHRLVRRRRTQPAHSPVAPISPTRASGKPPVGKGPHLAHTINAFDRPITSHPTGVGHLRHPPRASSIHR